MGEGLIGLIIFIIVINVLGRILKAVTSAGAATGAKGPKRQAPPRRTREQQILQELFELERERAGEAFEEGEIVEAAAVAEAALPPQAAAFEGAEEPGGLAKWGEERFEKTAAEADAFAYRPPPEVSPTMEIPVFPEGAATRVEVPGAVRRGRREGAVSPATVQQMLCDTPSLRTAILLSVILGPCRAKRRHR